MKQFLLLLIIPFLSISQVQIGQDIDGEAAGDGSGWSVSLSTNGSILAIGAPFNAGNGGSSGHVRIFENQSSTWTQIGQDIDGDNTSFFGDYCGYSISLSLDGSIVAIGSIHNTNGNGSRSGHVRIFQNQSGVWTQIGQDIIGEFAIDQSGFSLSLSDNGSIVAIGAPFNDDNGNNSGHVRIYENQSGVWTQIGQDIDGESADDRNGFSISLSSDGSVVAIGAPFNDGNGNNSGHVRIYENQSGTWTQIGQDIDGEFLGDENGWSVSLSADGSILAIGAKGNDANGDGSGHVRIYENQTGTWTQIGQDIDAETTEDQSGYSVSLSGNGSIVAIGAILNNGNGSDSGHVRVYQNIADSWTKIGTDIDGEIAGDQSGYAVSLSSDGFVVAIGSIRNDGNGSESGHVRVYDISGITLSSDSFVLENFSVSPNPTTDRVNISLTNNLKLKAVTVYNYFGQQIKITQSTEVDLSDVATGVYFIEIETNKGKASRKVVKK